MEKLKDDNFAKVFNVDGNQLLVYWTPEGEDGFKINQIFQCDFGEVNMALGFEKESTTAKVFNSYDKDQAESFYYEDRESINKMMGG